MDITSSSSGITKGRKSSHVFKWTINNFYTRYISIGCEGAVKISGPTFQVTHPDGESLTSWKLRVELDDETENMSAFLVLKKCPAEYLQDGLLCSLQIFLDHQSGLSKLGHSLKGSTRFKSLASNGWIKFISVKDLKAKNLMTNDMLRVRVELTLYADELESSITSVTCDSTSTSLVLQPKMSFESMLQNEEFSDVTVECGCETFPAHKAILAGRSNVFKTMLTSDMEEVNSGLIRITDMTPSTFQHILRYIYTGALGDDTDSEDLLELTYGAEKYGLEVLKKYCLTKFVACVTEENVGPLLIAAHLYGASGSVKNALKKFIEPKFFALMKKEEFRNMVAKNTEAFF